VADDEGFPCGVDNLWSQGDEVVERLDAFDLGQEPVDEAEVAADDSNDGRSIKYHRAEIRAAFGYREFTLADEPRLAAWLAIEVCPSELCQSSLTEALLIRCRPERIEPPGRMKRIKIPFPYSEVVFFGQSGTARRISAHEDKEPKGCSGPGTGHSNSAVSTHDKDGTTFRSIDLKILLPGTRDAAPARPAFPAGDGALRQTALHAR
jgi:hypothetical protein